LPWAKITHLPGAVRRCGGPALAALLASLALTACGSGQHDAEAACRHVVKSIKIYRQLPRPDGTPQQVHRILSRSLHQLILAEPLAALAATKSQRWQALATTLSQAGQVSEQHLAGALAEQCATAHVKLLPPVPPGPS
jgi:hypothetical protein